MIGLKKKNLHASLATVKITNENNNDNVIVTTFPSPTSPTENVSTGRPTHRCRRFLDRHHPATLRHLASRPAAHQPAAPRSADHLPADYRPADRPPADFQSADHRPAAPQAAFLAPLISAASNYCMSVD